MPPGRRLLGRTGETLAAMALEKNGYRILTRNYRTPFGEIDLIARHGECLVFIEVKLRRNFCYGTPLEAVTRTKKERLRLSAQHYLQEQGTPEIMVRFDVIAITLERGRAEIEIISGAFEE
jgi:putative endonuclease